MREIILTGLSVLFGVLILSAQNPKARYLNVSSDNNIRTHMNSEYCQSCSEHNYIVDGDESLGIVELNFDELDQNITATKAELLLNSSDVQWAESGQGFSVYYKDLKIGSIDNVKRNAQIVVNLDVSALGKSKSVKLVLKGDGEDGCYLLSKKSGFGAVLKLSY